VLKVDRLAIEGLPPLSFEVAATECLAIEGPSGSGKTRILRAVADLDPAGGYVYLEGAERSELPANAWRKRVRYVSAEPAWWADTARAHVTRPAELQRFERLAASLGIDRATLDRPIAQLSTGERLRLGLARAVCDEPNVVLLDEPTGALDAQSTALAEELIRFQLLAGRAVILVSHDAGQIGRVAHKRLLLAGPTPDQPPAAARPEPAPARPPADERLATLAQRWERMP
jgi:ABC-type iron transport system FetAB ATPase subunit